MLLDSVAKRQIAIASIALLQAYKIQTAFTQDSQFEILFLLDFLLLFAIYNFKIPKLVAPIWVYFAAYLAMSCLSAGIIGYVASKNQPEPSIIHHIPIPKSDSSNIMGSYIVNVVPPSRAKMNPESQSFCISDSSISIPIFIKGLSPWFLDYERISFNGEIHSFSNISIGIETDGKQTSFTYNLMVSEPGLYRIVQIREQAESITGRVINSTTRVVSCPIVSWNYPTDSKTIDKCVGSSIDFGISATGSPPFQIQYLKMIGDKSDTVTLDVNGVDETIEMNGFDQDIIDEISSSRKRLVTVPIHIDLTISKPYLFRLLKITDRFGNVLEFNEEKRGDFFLVETHGNPTAKFQKSGNVKIKRENQAVIPIQVVGSPPFNIQLTKFTDSEIGTPVYFNEMKSNSFTINLDPGVFVLTTITDKYCSSKIDSQPLSITETIQPKVSISSTPIEKSCVGQIGTLVNMTFSGEPPFKIEYKSTRDGKSTIETISDIKKSRYSVELKPLYPGTYKYEFIKISDVNYNNIEIDFKLSQVIHPISTAFFKSLNGIVCIGDSIDLAGTVTGSGPWIVSYEIQDASSNKQKFTIETTLSDFIITLPEFKHGGVFIVGLTLVVDGNGCSWTIDSADVTIEVSNSRPIALFKHDRLSILYNGIGQMPVSLSGRAPFEVVYKTPSESFITSKFDRDDGQYLQITGAGEYELISIKDSICTGTIPKDHKKFIATLIEKPTVTVQGNLQSSKGVFKMNPVCQFKPASITLEFKGTAPFTFYYSLKTPLVSENIEKIDGNSASYHFKSDESGLKEFEISRIDDELYKKISPNIFISLQVYENPIAEILNGPEISFKCNKSENIIQVKVSGSFPVKLTLEIIHNLKVNRVLINVNETLFNYSPVLETGKNTIVLIGVLDNNGCESNFEGKSKSKIIVNVLERPRIAGIERKDACSGDVLSYQLQGQAPFQVNYQIGGVDSFVTCHDSVVLFYASTPGDFVITGVCNGGGCCADVFLLTRIHALPKAIIHNGEDFSLDLREGQETKIKVELVGESPFGLSWTRRIDGVTETFNAQDIKEDEYMINTSREGLYQVVSVSDGFCKYPRVEVEGANAVNVVV